MSQTALIFTLLGLVVLGVGAIALLAAYAARQQESEGSASPSHGSGINVDEAVEIHRRHVFLRRHPEWQDRDFIADQTSPWYTDPEFAPLNRRS